MRIPRFYTDLPLKLGSDIELPNDIHRHAIQVLRLKTNENIILFNGQGGEYLCRLIIAEKRKSAVNILSFDPVDRESPLETTLVLAMIKQDKMDFAIQKAVEMGVTHIQPIYTQRSVIKIKSDRLDKKMSHWAGIINAACEQSGRTAIPQLSEPTALDNYLNTPVDCLRLAMLPGDFPDITALDQPTNNKMMLIVGPEGGFTDEEVDLLLASNVSGIKFGPRILRAETAVISGMALAQAQWGDI